MIDNSDPASVQVVVSVPLSSADFEVTSLHNVWITTIGLVTYFVTMVTRLRFSAPGSPSLHRKILRLFNTSRSEQNGRYFAAETLTNALSLKKVLVFSSKFHFSVFRGVQLAMTRYWFRLWLWQRTGDKLFPEWIITQVLKHICVTKPQWVNQRNSHYREIPMAFQCDDFWVHSKDKC